MSIVLKMVGMAIVMKESIKEQPCVWLLILASILTIGRIVYIAQAAERMAMGL